MPSPIPRIHVHLLARGVFACCLSLSACNNPPQTHVEQDWSNAIARLDFISIYPITEDLAPGDVLLSIPPSGDAIQPSVQRLGYLDKGIIMKALLDQEARLSLAPLTKPAAATASPAATASAANAVNVTANSAAGATITTSVKVTPAAAAKPAPPAKGKPSPTPSTPLEPDVLDADAAQTGSIKPRLRRVAVPGVVAATVTQGDFGGGGTSGHVSLGAVFGGRKQSAVSVYLKQLETVGIDTLPAVEMLETERFNWIKHSGFTAPRLLFIAFRADSALGERLCRGLPPRPGERRALIQVVNRVLYAHAIQFGFDSESTYAGKLAVSLAQNAAASGAAAGAAPPSAVPPATMPNAQQAAAAAQSQVTTLSSSLALPSSPGVRTDFGIGSTGEVTLEDTFDRPMAVGYTPVNSYSVRGSIIFTGATENESDDQARQLANVCPHVSDPDTLKGGLQPIERLACANTVLMQSEVTKIALPTTCFVSGFSNPSAHSLLEQFNNLRPDVKTMVAESEALRSWSPDFRQPK